MQTGLYINGQWTTGSLESRAVNNPATGEELIKVAQANTADT